MNNFLFFVYPVFYYVGARLVCNPSKVQVSVHGERFSGVDCMALVIARTWERLASVCYFSRIINYKSFLELPFIPFAIIWELWVIEGETKARATLYFLNQAVFLIKIPLYGSQEFLWKYRGRGVFWTWIQHSNWHACGVWSLLTKSICHEIGRASCRERV